MKPSLADRLIAFDEKNAAARSRLITEHAIEDALGVGLEKVQVTVFDHTAVTAWVTIRVPRVELPMILKHLPEPEPAMKVRAACLSFVPKDVQEKQPDKGQEETEIFPYWIEIDPASFSRRVSVVFFSILAGHLVRVLIETPLFEWHGQIDVDIRSKDHPGYSTIEKCDLEMAERLRYLEDVASSESPIRWASGGSNYPNRFTLYWGIAREFLPAEAKAAFIQHLQLLTKDKTA